MGGGEQEAHASAPRQRNRAARLPKDVHEALPPAVARAWRLIVQHLPAGLYLAGGTATALRLRHRRSNDLDFFFHHNAVDLDALRDELSKRGAAIDLRAPGTLRVYVARTKLNSFMLTKFGSSTNLRRLRSSAA